jgi:hypothetical protein
MPRVRSKSTRKRGTRIAIRRAAKGHKNEGGESMTEPADNAAFTVLKLLGYVALAAIAASIVYAAIMALRYWPGIAV